MNGLPISKLSELMNGHPMSDSAELKMDAYSKKMDKYSKKMFKSCEKYVKTGIVDLKKNPRKLPVVVDDDDDIPLTPEDFDYYDDDESDGDASDIDDSNDEESQTKFRLSTETRTTIPSRKSVSSNSSQSLMLTHDETKEKMFSNDSYTPEERQRVKEFWMANRPKITLKFVRLVKELLLEANDPEARFTGLRRAYNQEDGTSAWVCEENSERGNDNESKESGDGNKLSCYDLYLREGSKCCMIDIMLG